MAFFLGRPISFDLIDQTRSDVEAYDPGFASFEGNEHIQRGVFPAISKWEIPRGFFVSDRRRGRDYSLLLRPVSVNLGPSQSQYIERVFQRVLTWSGS
jgi:hypothetical protein